MELTFERGAVALLLIASLVAIVCRRLRLPYSVGLVAAGVGIALLPFAPHVSLTKELIFDGLLPPLIFEAAFYLPWTELRKQLKLILLLATVGVLIAAAITTTGMHVLAHWQWTSALLFGVLIAATDPVSVIAIFREANAQGRLRLLIESESLFNDGTAAVAFGIAASIAAGQAVSPAGIIGSAIATTGGGVLCGALVGRGVLYLIVRTQDRVVETACTVLAAYGSFLLAESLHASGVFATLTAGLIVGNIGTRGPISEHGLDALHSFWEFAAFAANSVIFLLVGMEEGGHQIGSAWLPALIAIVVVTLGRAATIYPICRLFSRSSLWVPIKQQHVLVWGGLRGALALGLVLGLPHDTPGREEMITVSFAVVAFSIFVQGLTIEPLLRSVGEIARRPTEPRPVK
jgi:CPA1 family monovalent cation:H+ antiporter